MSTATIQTAWGTTDLPTLPSYGEVSLSEAALTDRELEVLTLIARGYSNQEIAALLYLSINSIKTYVRSAYRRINVERRTQAVLWALSRIPQASGTVAQA
ncbi:response regulator transcription factor [Nocardioides sp.]|uniref:response regulator transcription factor n=1 Tax=Nocardioides sp. TaxID=35761 RepID=UPI002B26EB86|nr:LuxR C-terminal-related transcriptional regulator [Nocardioides sp.]